MMGKKSNFTERQKIDVNFLTLGKKIDVNFFTLGPVEISGAKEALRTNRQKIDVLFFGKFEQKPKFHISRHFYFNS